MKLRNWAAWQKPLNRACRKCVSKKLAAHAGTHEQRPPNRRRGEQIPAGRRPPVDVLKVDNSAVRTAQIDRLKTLRETREENETRAALDAEQMPQARKAET